MTTSTLTAVKWVVTTLKADSTFNTAVGGRVYSGNIPGNKAYPLVRVEKAGSRPERASSNHAQAFMYTESIRVRVVNEGLDETVLAGLVTQVRALLDGKFGSVTGGTVLACIETQEVPIPGYLVAGVPYHETLLEFEVLTQ